jgi:hypothetical protein
LTDTHEGGADRLTLRGAPEAPPRPAAAAKAPSESNIKALKPHKCKIVPQASQGCKDIHQYTHLTGKSLIN